MKKITSATLALTTLGLLGTAFAAPKISAQSIIVNPTQPDLSVNVRVNKDTTGNNNPTYRIGETISIDATVNRDAYVYLFDVAADGVVTQILPNRLSSANFVKANTTVRFPAAGAGFQFNVDGPVGQSKVLALASLTPLDLTQITSFKSSQESFATVTGTGQSGLAQALSIVVNPVPQNSWVTDVAFYNVAPVQAVQTGSLYVGTDVANATIYLNNQRLGTSNTTLQNIRPGSYTLRITAPGYRDYTTTVNIGAGTILNYGIDLTPVAVVTPAPVNTTVTTGNTLLDLIGGLLGAVTTPATIQDPAQAAINQKVTDLQRQGYTITRNTYSTTTGYVAVLQKGASSVTVTVERRADRIVAVQTTETILYRY